MTGLIVLDIDETMISSCICSHDEPDPENIDDFDFSFEMPYRKDVYKVWIKKRPFLDQFLEYVISNFRIAVFTAADRVYAEEILRHLGILDKLEFFKSRESMTWGFGFPELIVDLKRLSNIPGIDLKKTIIIDDTKEVASRNRKNLLLVPKFDVRNRNCKHDATLLKVMSILQSIADEPDWRVCNKRIN